MQIVGHKLVRADGSGFEFKATPNLGGILKPEYLVIHFTAATSARSSIDWLVNPAAKASAHLVIARDGSITQLAPFDRVAWHAGPSQWLGRQGMNLYSIGIELDNAGKLTRSGDTWRTWFGAVIPPHDVVQAVHKNETAPCGWHTYTEAQIAAALEASTVIVRHYGLRDVIGHDDISPTFKTDPGPAFPMESFRSRVIGRQDDTPPELVTTDKVNIRSGPGTEFATIPGSPLEKGARARLLKSQGVWRYVDVLEAPGATMDVVGWVHSRYLTAKS